MHVESLESWGSSVCRSADRVVVDPSLTSWDESFHLGGVKWGAELRLGLAWPGLGFGVLEFQA